MLKYFLATSLFSFSFISLLKSQSPGGISASNKMWLRSDNGVTAPGNIVSQWQEVSGANVTGNFTVQSIAGTATAQTSPTLIPAGINFNPYISFNGVTNSLSSINSFLGTALVSNSNVTVFQVINFKSGAVWLKWETDFTGTTARLGFENAAGKIRFDFPKAVPASAGQNIGVTNVLNKDVLSTCFANTSTSVNRLTGADDNTIPIPGPGNFAAANARIVIGNEYLLNLPCKIDMAEVIIYSTTLTAAERNKIESYLAVKYGFTLNQLAANNNNYVATNSTITWDRALNSTYANDITGIGRDDATALLQKQSRSVNTSGLVTLYNGTYAAGVFPTDNSSNTNGFTNDFSFLLTGDNGSTTALDQCALGGRVHRMQRVWKASKTGTVADVTIVVDQAAVPANVKYLLVSTNAAFPAGTTTVLALNLAGGKLYSAALLNHNDYFTFASDSIPLPLLQDTTICVNLDGTVRVLNPIAGAVYNWYNLATGGTLVGTGTSITLPNLQNDTTVYVEMTTVFNCILQPRVPVTIHVQTVATPQGSVTQPGCMVSTGSVTITSPTGPGYQYCINGSSCQPGLTFTNLPPGPYTITAANATGCISPVFSFTINTQPPSPAAPTVNAPVTICPNQTATLAVTNPVAGDTYNWYTSATATNPVFTGISYTTPVLLAATIYYAEAVNAQGCASSRTSADVLRRTKLIAPLVTVVAVTDSSILFSWMPVPGANAYIVSTDGINYRSPSSGVNGTTHFLSGLLAFTNYTLYVKALDTLITCITSNDGTATGKTLKRYEGIYVPSGFTPNGDAINNTLRVFGDIRSYKFEVFNRYGQLVFSTTSLNAGWDGTFKGTKQAEGTYVWYLSAILNDGKMENISGTTVLIR